MSERLAVVEQLLCERYNVRTIDGPLKEAIDADDVASLRKLLGERDLYRWHAAIFAALPADEPPVQPGDDSAGRARGARRGRLEVVPEPANEESEQESAGTDHQDE